jgi:hypothetical protein
MKTKTTILLFLLLICSTAFGQEAQQAVAESCERLVFGGVWTLTEAKKMSGNLWGTFFVSGVFSIPLMATWNGDIPTIARILFWIPAVIAIVAFISAIVLWFGIMFSTAATPAM